MIQVANAPCSWGVLEFELEGEAAAYPQVLDEMRETGYAGTELGDWGFMPTEPEPLSEALVERELSLLGAFVPVPWAEAPEHEAAWKMALRAAKLMRDAGFPQAFLVLADANGTNARRTARAGRVTADDGWSGEQWTVAARAIESFARRIREETGLRSVFHHHAGGFVETPAEVARLMELTEQVGLVLDTGHYLFGGGDPLAALRKFGERIWHVHFKDCHAAVAEDSRKKEWDYFQSVGHGVFCKLGEGMVDFPGIVDELRRQAYDGWIVVEQDVLPGMGAPRDCARDNREYLRGLGL